MRAIKTVVMLLGLAGFAVSSHAAAVSLPFSDGFESPEYTNGVAIPTTYWSYTTNAVATNSPSPKDGSVLSAYAEEGISLAIESGSSNVWFTFYAKITASETNDPPTPDGVAAFFVNSDGDLRAYSSNVWTTLASGVATDDWLGFAMHLDYDNQVWDLYKTAGSYTYGDDMVKQNATPLGFNTNYTDSSSMTNITVEGVTYLDSVRIYENASAESGQDLPFFDGFESETNGLAISGAGWRYSDTAYATNFPPPKDGSTLSAYAPNGMSLALNKVISNELYTSYSKVWYSCYARVNASHTNDPSIGDAVAAFFVNSDGELKAYSNNTWIVVDDGVNTNDWLGFAVHLDYDNEVWDLYRTTNNYTYGDGMVKQNAMPMGFNTSYTHSGSLTNVAITGDTYLDTVRIDQSIQAVIAGEDSEGNVAVVDLVDGSDGSAVSLQYFGTSGTLHSTFGLELGKLFAASDTITYWDAGSGQLFEASWDGSDWSTNLTVTPTTGMFLSKTGSETTRTVAYSSTFSHQDAGATDIANGWNLLAIPRTAQSVAINSAGLPAPTANDYVFMRSATGWSISRYTGSTWSPNITLLSGRTFWLYRGGGVTTWNSHLLD